MRNIHIESMSKERLEQASYTQSFTTKLPHNYGFSLCCAVAVRLTVYHRVIDKMNNEMKMNRKLI